MGCDGNVYMYVPLHVGLRGHLHGVRVLGKVAVGLWWRM